MIGMKSVSAALAAVLMMASTSALASTCRDTCDDQNIGCERAGKAEDQCLAAWHQCKNRCDTPVIQKTSAVQTPTPKPAVTKVKPKKPN